MSFKLFSKSLRKLIPAFLVLAALQFMTGCGGGGGGSSAPVVIVPDLAPSSIINRTITITDPDQAQVQTKYTFDVSTYSSPSSDSGSYSYTKVSGSTTQARLQLVSLFAPVLNYQLTFTSAAGGTYIDQSSKSGSFTIQ
jgi:hypothetical protein